MKRVFNLCAASLMLTLLMLFPSHAADFFPAPDSARVRAAEARELAAQDPFAGEGEKTEARDITAACTVTLKGEPANEKLLDGDEITYQKYSSAVFEIASSEPVGALYLRFDKTPPRWRVEASDKSLPCGENGFLHEYVALPYENVRSLRLVFEEETALSDLTVLSAGEILPDFVQVWQPAEGRADIVMFPAHSDDDQLFFAGSAPDAVARGAVMQVCYFTNHWNSHRRPHELLNGLWTCGITRYPVIGALPDLRSMSVEEGLEKWAEVSFSYDDMVRMQVELLRRFRPQIVLAHDENGEYGHGAHRLDSLSLRDAVIAAGDYTKYPESAEEYGVWDTPKTYVHLWGENQIDFEIDVPLERFDGKTAYQVSQDAFKKHLSQMSSRYGLWLLGSEDEPVTAAGGFNGDGTYGPRAYGLWRSTVGRDLEKKDFYEHITLYREQERAARQLLEEYDQAQKAEFARLLQSEKDEFAAMKNSLEESLQRTRIAFYACMCLGALAFLTSGVLLSALLFRRKREKRSEK